MRTAFSVVTRHVLSRLVRLDGAGRSLPKFYFSLISSHAIVEPA
jgi:hypothetical protein